MEGVCKRSHVVPFLKLFNLILGCSILIMLNLYGNQTLKRVLLAEFKFNNKHRKIIILNFFFSCEQGPSTTKRFSCIFNFPNFDLFLHLCSHITQPSSSCTFPHLRFSLQFEIIRIIKSYVSVRMTNCEPWKSPHKSDLNVGLMGTSGGVCTLRITSRDGISLWTVIGDFTAWMSWRVQG